MLVVVVVGTVEKPIAGPDVGIGGYLATKFIIQDISRHNTFRGISAKLLAKFRTFLLTFLQKKYENFRTDKMATLAKFDPISGAPIA